MKKPLISALFFLVVIYCKAQNLQDFDMLKLNAFGISRQLSDEWIKDSVGCLGNRIAYVDTLAKNTKLLKIDYADFIRIFGKPNRIINNSTIEYYIQTKCDNNGKPVFVPEQFSLMHFYFEDKKLAACQFVIS